MRQAYADEILYGFSSIAFPDTTADRDAIGSVIAGLPNSLVEQHVDACPDSDEETEDKQKEKVKAADEDAETTEDVDAAERLTAFLGGADRNKATAQMLFSLAKNDIPFSWGCVRLELTNVYINTLAVLNTRAALSHADDPLARQVPTLAGWLRHVSGSPLNFLVELSEATPGHGGLLITYVNGTFQQSSFLGASNQACHGQRI